MLCITPRCHPGSCLFNAHNQLNVRPRLSLCLRAVQSVENACGVRRGLALMNVTAWGALNMTVIVEHSLGSGLARKCLASGERYDEDRLALPAVQEATIGRVQCVLCPCRPETKPKILDLTSSLIQLSSRPSC